MSASPRRAFNLYGRSLESSSGITAAANVDITLIVVLYVIRLVFWNNVDTD